MYHNRAFGCPCDIVFVAILEKGIYQGETEVQPVFKLSASEFEEVSDELSYTLGQSNLLMM